MNNKPLYWIFRGYLYDKDPSDWTVHEHPDVPVIPLYTHPAKTLTDEDIKEFITVFPIIFTPMDLLGFAKAILRKAQEK